MQIRYAVLGLATALSLTASCALAAPTPVSAKLQTPIEGSKKPVAGSAIFICEGDTCTASNPSSQTITAGGCRELVRAVGPVISFGSEGRQLDADKLATCNKAARK